MHKHTIDIIDAQVDMLALKMGVEGEMVHSTVDHIVASLLPSLVETWLSGWLRGHDDTVVAIQSNVPQDVCNPNCDH